MLNRWHHGLLSRLDGEKVLKESFSKYCKKGWLVRVSPATELPAVSKVYPADQGVSTFQNDSTAINFLIYEKHYT